MPAWLWRRASPIARVAFVAVLLLAVGSAIVLLPAIQETKRETAAREAAERRTAQAERVRTLRAEQRVLRARAMAPPPPPDSARAVRIAARERLLGDIETRILADARARRLADRLRRVSCNPFPRTVRGRDPRQDLRRRSGRYQCLAVTAEIAPTATNSAGVIGYPYRVLIDFRTGRYAYCKISGVPGEGSLEAKREVTVPKACGGI